MTESPEQYFDTLVRREPARPFVTYYDEHTGERSELSVRSLGNWVAKTHFLLSDELALGVGDRALIALPAHWISVPAVLGSLTAGLELVTAGDAEVGFLQPAAFPATVKDAYGINPEAAAGGLPGDAPPGLSDYVSAVRPQPDKWPDVQLVAGPGDPGLDGAPRREVVERARARAEQLGLPPGGRAITDRSWTSADDIVETLLAPLVMGGSVVYVRGADDATFERRAFQERTTTRI